MTKASLNDGPGIDLDETARLIDALERDLARIKSGQDDFEHLRADVEQLRAAISSARPNEDVHGGLTGLRDKLHSASDELLADAIRTGDYISRIGRLLGM